VIKTLSDHVTLVQVIFMIDSTFTYLLYYLIGVVGILDIAKQYLLQERLDITALLFCQLEMF